MSYQQPYQQPPPPPGAYPTGPTVCPFCGGTSPTQICGWCGRDMTAPRRPCPNCRRMVPSLEPQCWSCGAKFKSDMSWKIPLIILLFVIAIVVGIILAMAR